ncbi:DUF2244 domain-containing protein [Wenxinia saemankumensis]|uniref:Uncharacterized membrane protein n=1 Tax=Wenxinia saemankumensis TaxID=1447782 RepID=A0A1M6HB34_9RHOB|nr:DUF2244 domain-containing protein [Wenxinia saemankumensis]SHJ19323.1 Uncharacterized membrane protein [Wenxinia saemankumensis]
MPYRWTDTPDESRLDLWPHRSLSADGFVLVIGATAAFISLPLLAVIGTAVLWGLLPFLVLAVAGLWIGLRRSYRDADMAERLILRPGQAQLERRDPDGQRQRWEADPFWIQVRLHAKAGPVEDYLTLTGGGREVEIGAFLTPEERRRLDIELRRRIAAMR